MMIFDWMVSYPGLLALAVGDIAVLSMFARWDARHADRLWREMGLHAGAGPQQPLRL
ncbi:hypothetical protein [Variovorax ginsengisoli]|uniref:Uncharacterized protein n=1 Tax=Variovorax ginsengisoli TaxID=363844 RepID=A0ABT9SCF3_9BURK|nr:hypothetical protein [Variovorax ginsengisoli]MDP9901057.1 hypothetical protein [Variovorax ginsengisoli]